MNVTKEIANEDNFYFEDNQRHKIRITPQIVSTLQFDLIFDETEKSIMKKGSDVPKISTKKGGFSFNSKAASFEKSKNLSELTLPSIFNLFFNSTKTRLRLIC